MKEEQFTPAESLQLIQSMIDKTKQNLSVNSHYFLLWGWITFVACIGQFLLKHILTYERHYLVWWVIVLGIAGSIYFSIRDAKTRRVKTFIGETMAYLWTGMGITFFIVSMIISKIGWETNVFPFFMVLYGLGTFVSGSILKFKPLIIGGIISWILSVIAVYLSYDYQILMAALAILFSYIIPGHLLRNKK
ncbi:MAG: hypothetical protein ACKVOW_09535 [Chitinophagaceae bacterium]